MKKLNQQKINNLLNYKQFLTNNYLKTKIYKLKNIFFENPVLYNNSNLESYIIEFNSYENIYLPFTLTTIGKVSTIDLKYKNIIFFNYDLTYNILYQFNKIMFKTTINKKTNSIKGRLLGGNWNNKKILISILGFIFPMKPINLNNALNYKKKKYFNKYNKKGFIKKKINTTRLINYYKVKYLNFQIILKKNIKKKNKKELSRLSYINTIFENQKVKNKNLKKTKKKINKKSVLSN